MNLHDLPEGDKATIDQLQYDQLCKLKGDSNGYLRDHRSEKLLSFSGEQKIQIGPKVVQL